jgi:hypothetical protein
MYKLYTSEFIEKNYCWTPNLVFLEILVFVKNGLPHGED